MNQPTNWKDVVIWFLGFATICYLLTQVISCILVVPTVE